MSDHVLETEATADGPAVSPGPRTNVGLAEVPAEVQEKEKARSKEPKLRFLITESALAEMRAEVLAHANIETAWGQYGLIIRGKEEDTVILTGVLRPSPSEVTRQFAHASVGGEQQAQAVRWLEANVALAKQLGIYSLPGTAQEDEPHFAFLFKGHSHHGLQVEHYSGTDHASIREFIETDGGEVAVGSLATLDLRSTPWRRITPRSTTIESREELAIRFKFYILTKRMFEAGIRSPVLMVPEIVEATEVPYTPPVGWHLVREAEFLEQLRHCYHHGCNVKVQEREVGGGPPYEVQFIISKADWRGTLVITTDWDYPNTPPRIDVLPKRGLPSKTAPLEVPFEGPDWKHGFDFIDVIRRLERKGVL